MLKLKHSLIAGLTFVLGLGTLAVSPPGETAGASATLTHILGVVQAHTHGGWRGSVSGQRLYPGMTVRTGNNSRLQLRYDDGSVVRLGARSVMRIRMAQDIRLLRGKAHIQKQKSAQQLRVRTPVAQAAVLGTELFVSHNDDNVSHVTTLTGKVEVQGELGDKQYVNPGEWVEIEPGKPVEKPTAFDWDELKRKERFLLDMDFVPQPGELDDSEDWK